MSKKRFSPQKNISRSFSHNHKEKQIEQTMPSGEGTHFESIIKNVSHSYKKHKQNSIVRNTLFFTFIFLVLLSAVSWGLPRILSFRFDSVSAFFSQVNPVEIFTPENEEMNVLILGVGGSENSAPNLTDSIMYVHYDGKDPASVVTISVPRDLYVQSPTLGKTKINSLYSLNRKPL